MLGMYLLRHHHPPLLPEEHTVPMTIESATAEYDVATPEEADALVAAFEAATDAHAAVKAATPEPEGKFRYDAPERVAYTEALAPTAEALRLANNALAACGNLPVGTVVRFSSSAGWSGTDTSEGKISRVTGTSYVVDKSRYEGSYTDGNARLDRERAHDYQSSYGGTRGARSMSIVRTPRQERAYLVAVEERKRQASAEQAVFRAQRDAEQARRDALGAQQGILAEARRKAVQIVLQRHAAEYDALVASTLDLLALDAPGRTETA